MGPQDKVTRPKRQTDRGPRAARRAEPTRRDSQKAATRAKIVEAARDLFAERGYHAATVRDIATRAGVSPGSLFTSFSGKAELLREIVNARLGGLLTHASGALARGDSAEATLVAMAERAYAYELKELRLLAESIGASWTWDPDTEAANRSALGQLLSIISAVLQAGKVRGELSGEADLVLLTQTIFSCYLQNFRLAIFDGWTPERLAKLLGAQIRLILAGASPR